MNIDWRDAPEDATHWQPENLLLRAAWLKRDGGSWLFRTLQQSNWVRFVGEDSDLGAIVGRPVFWSGEGLPPVGAELEAGFACEDFAIWHKGVCVAVGEDPEGREEFCVVKFGHKIAMYRAEGGRMRPIRTPEQVAADERLHEIRNALTTIKAGEQQFPNDIVRGNIVVATVEAMIDAGYRLQVTK